MRVTLGWANAMLALILHEGERLIGVSLFDIDGAGRIRRVFHALNPAKLAHLYSSASD
jgi:hypothetical protein